MPKNLGILALLILLCTSPILAGSNLSQKSPVLAARECKMLLKPERFGDRATGFAELLKLIKRACLHTELPFTPETDSSKESIRLISFLDTAKLDLYRGGYVLRRRQDAVVDPHGKIRSDGRKFELSFKFRHPEAKVAVERSIKVHSGLQGKDSFEENLLLKESTIDRVYDHSTSVKLKTGPGKKLSELAMIFPDLGNLGIEMIEPIVLVNDVNIIEYQRELGVIDLGMGATAKAVVSVWYRDQVSQPLIAEFSFKSRLASGDRLNFLINHSRRRSDDLLRELQKSGSDWIAIGATKTGLIYNTMVPNQD